MHETRPMTYEAHHVDHEEPGVIHAHVSPLWQLALIFILLLILTFFTVIVSTNLAPLLGSAGIFVALLIAAVKGGLVVLYFMHMRYDSPFNAMIFCMALLFVSLMIGFTLVDTHQYAPNLLSPPAVGNAP